MWSLEGKNEGIEGDRARRQRQDHAGPTGHNTEPGSYIFVDAHGRVLSDMT